MGDRTTGRRRRSSSGHGAVGEPRSLRISLR